MVTSSKSWLARFGAACRARFFLLLELLALRHQAMVLQRSGRRPEFSPLDRLFWIIIATIWPDWKNALEIIQPETVNRWRRQGWRVLLFGRFRKNRGGRPPVDKEIRLLIKRMPDHFITGVNEKEMTKLAGLHGIPFMIESHTMDPDMRISRGVQEIIVERQHRLEVRK